MVYPQVQYELVTAESTEQLDTRIVKDMENKERNGLQLVDMHIDIPKDSRRMKAILKYATLYTPS